MKECVTLTLEREYLEYLDDLARQAGWSRSTALEALIREHLHRHPEVELARLAAEFFARPETLEEAAEREDWESLGMEVLGRDG